MLKLLFFAIVLLCLSYGANPGVKIGVTQRALNYAAKRAVGIMAKEIPKIRIPNISGKKFLRYQVKNTRISSFIKPTAAIVINPGSGLTIKLKDGGIRVDARWGIKLFFFWIRGGISASADDIDLGLGVGISASGGRLRLSSQHCNAHLGGFRVRTSGSILSWLVNIILHFFNGVLRKKVEKEVCKKLADVINDDANDELSSFNYIAKITNDIKLDYHLTEQPNFFSTHLDSSHKGRFLGDPQTAFLPASTNLLLSRMVSTTVSDETLNSLGRVLHSKSLFDYRFTITDRLFEKFFKGIDIGDFKLNLHVYSTKAPFVAISASKLIAKVAVDAEFGVPRLVLKLGVEVEADCTIKIEGDRIKGKVGDIRLRVSVKLNELGQDLDADELNQLAEGLIPYLLPIINNKLNDGIPLPKIKHVSISNYALQLSHRQIRIAYDIK